MCCDPLALRVGTISLLGPLTIFLVIVGWSVWTNRSAEGAERLDGTVEPDLYTKQDSPTDQEQSTGGFLSSFVSQFVQEGCAGLFKLIACGVGLILLALGQVIWGGLKAGLCSIWVLQMCQ